MSDGRSFRPEIAAAARCLATLRRDGEISAEVFATLSLGLDALLTQDERAAVRG